MSHFSSQNLARTSLILLGLQISGWLLGSALTLRVAGPDAAVSFALAGGLVIISMVTLGLVLWVMFLKKSIALLVVVIVFKWPILIYLLHSILESIEVNALGFSLGAMVWMPSTLAWHFLVNEE